ncbi:hypothetical protein MNB_SM-4-1164 [hydrothermal vent metagenome]|uniref:Uncharacterized protein n=1 Tax=hydrothermal vent metagenome TaxID=652676 RepID=A0A1W1CFF8_9ZZZZ
MTKAIAPLQKAVIKQAAKMALAPIPFIGWGIAAWTVVDTIGIAMELNDLVNEHDILEKALDTCTKKEKKSAPPPKAEKTGKGGNKVKGKGKKPRRGCGKKGKHKDKGTDSERDKKPVEERMDSDHIPSQEHVKRDMDKKYKSDGYSKAEMNCMKKYVSENMDTIMLPNDIHSGVGAKTAQTQPNSKAYKKYASDFKTKNARDPNLHEIAKREAEIVEKEVDKKRKPNDKCGKKIKETLKDFKNLDKDYFTKLYEEAIDNIVDCLKKKRK